jgi:hypothetical protein
MMKSERLGSIYFCDLKKITHYNLEKINNPISITYNSKLLKEKDKYI